MPRSDSAFREFEHQGWSARDVTSGYHDCLSPVTTQAVGPLLDAAGIDGGMRVLDLPLAEATPQRRQPVAVRM
jgi:hypothetical protein